MRLLRSPALLCSLFGAAAAWLLTDPPEPPVTQPVSEDHWRLPEPVHVEVGSIAAELLERRPWGEQEDPSREPETTPLREDGVGVPTDGVVGLEMWRFAGVGRESGEASLYFLSESGESRRAAVGGRAPTGATIESAGRDWVALEQADGKTILRLYEPMLANQQKEN